MPCSRGCAIPACLAVGVPAPGGVCSWGVCSEDTPQKQTATVADGTHPTGCILVFLKFSHFSPERSQTLSLSVTESEVWIGNLNVKARKTTTAQTPQIMAFTKIFAKNSGKQAHLRQIHRIQWIQQYFKKENSAVCNLQATVWWLWVRYAVHLVFDVKSLEYFSKCKNDHGLLFYFIILTNLIFI